MKKIQLKINTDFWSYKSGQIIKVMADDNGTPIDRFWRDRLRDSAIDNCVSRVYNPNKRQSKSKRHK